MKILYNSEAIRTCIRRLFAKPSHSDRRVVLVAYIGQDYAKYLPDSRGIEIVCSPTAGATSIVAVTELQEAGALIQFSDKLHMKVYWSAERGCLITSANLSANALGIKGLKEAGVLVDAKQVKIDELLREAKPYAVTEPRLNRLKLSEDKIKRAMAREGMREPQSGFQYVDWYKLKTPARTNFKLGYWDATCGVAEAGKQLVKVEHGRSEPVDHLGTTKVRLKRHDWVLTFKVVFGKITNVIGKANWMYVDYVVRVKKNEPCYEEELPYQAIQALPIRYYPRPPFPITAAFTKALKGAVAKLGEASVDSKTSVVPSKELLNDIARRIGTQTAQKQKPAAKRRPRRNKPESAVAV